MLKSSTQEVRCNSCVALAGLLQRLRVMAKEPEGYLTYVRSRCMSITTAETNLSDFCALLREGGCIQSCLNILASEKLKQQQLQNIVNRESRAKGRPKTRQLNLLAELKQALADKNRANRKPISPLSRKAPSSFAGSKTAPAVAFSQKPPNPPTTPPQPPSRSSACPPQTTGTGAAVPPAAPPLNPLSSLSPPRKHTRSRSWIIGSTIHKINRQSLFAEVAQGRASLTPPAALPSSPPVSDLMSTHRNFLNEIRSSSPTLAVGRRQKKNSVRSSGDEMTSEVIWGDKVPKSSVQVAAEALLLALWQEWGGYEPSRALAVFNETELSTLDSLLNTDSNNLATMAADVKTRMETNKRLLQGVRNCIKDKQKRVAQKQPKCQGQRSSEKGTPSPPRARVAAAAKRRRPKNMTKFSPSPPD